MKIWFIEPFFTGADRDFAKRKSLWKLLCAACKAIFLAPPGEDTLLTSAPNRITATVETPKIICARRISQGLRENIRDQHIHFE